jgi:uncharacterized protein (DUF952 family)
MNLLYRIMTADEWRAFEKSGSFAGAAHDVHDGFIHLSAENQVEGTLAAHYSGRTGLRLLTIRADLLEAAAGTLTWEVSRDGALFPHFYGALPLEAVVSSVALDSSPAVLEEQIAIGRRDRKPRK